jgi:hypothetical protein
MDSTIVKDYVEVNNVTYPAKQTKRGGDNHPLYVGTVVDSNSSICDNGDVIAFARLFTLAEEDKYYVHVNAIVAKLVD